MSRIDLKESACSIRVIRKNLSYFAHKWVQMRNERETERRLILDRESIKKTRELGFNFSKTFENRLKQLINKFANVYSLNNWENCVIETFIVRSFQEEPLIL